MPALTEKRFTKAMAQLADPKSVTSQDVGRALVEPLGMLEDPKMLRKIPAERIKDHLADEIYVPRLVEVCRGTKEPAVQVLDRFAWLTTRSAVRGHGGDITFYANAGLDDEDMKTFFEGVVRSTHVKVKQLA
jgi:hypothetical protein